MRISGVPDTAMLSVISISTIFHMGDWDGDGDFDVILGPVTSRFDAYSETDSYTTGYYLEQVNRTLIYRPDHPLASAFAFGKEQDLSWKILDCDGDGNLDIIRFQMRPTASLHRSPEGLEVDFLQVHLSDHVPSRMGNSSATTPVLKVLLHILVWKLDSMAILQRVIGMEMVIWTSLESQLVTTAH